MGEHNPSQKIPHAGSRPRPGAVSSICEASGQECVANMEVRGCVPTPWSSPEDVASTHLQSWDLELGVWQNSEHPLTASPAEVGRFFSVKSQIVNILGHALSVAVTLVCCVGRRRTSAIAQ